MSETFRELKAEARTALHGRFAVAVKCLRGGIESPTITDVECRIHTQETLLGDLPASGLPFAERVEQTPRLVFLTADHTPVQGNVYVVSATEAYECNKVDVPDGVTVTAQCSRFTGVQANRWHLASE